MNDLNAVEIKGTVMYEPSVRSTKNDSTMSTFSVCVKHNEPSKAKDYLNVVAWGDVADQVREEFHAGTRIGIKGHLRKQMKIRRPLCKSLQRKSIIQKMKLNKLYKSALNTHF